MDLKSLSLWSKREEKQEKKTNFPTQSKNKGREFPSSHSPISSVLFYGRHYFFFPTKTGASYLGESIKAVLG
jgi:hypothetical protein